MKWGMWMWMGKWCMMGRYMDKHFPMQQAMSTAPVADTVVAPTPTEEAVVVPAEEIAPVVVDEETLPE
jgi:hypothetical protein